MGTSTRKQRNAGYSTHKGLENFDHLGADFKKKISKTVGTKSQTKL